MNKFQILLILTTYLQFGSFQDTCSVGDSESSGVSCFSGKCCGPYSDWANYYTCCPNQSFCGSTICVGYWVVIVPCVCVGIAIFAGIFIIITQRKRRARRLQQQVLLQQNPQPQINQPQVYYVPQPQPGIPSYQPGQPGMPSNYPGQPGMPSYYPGQPGYNQDQPDQPQYGQNQQTYQ